MNNYIKSITEALLIIEEKIVRTKEEEIVNGQDSTLHQGIHHFDHGWDFDALLHGPSQAKDRQPKWKAEDWQDLLSRGHAAIVDPAKQVARPGNPVKKVKTGQAIIYSLGKQQGFVVNVTHNKTGEPKLGGKTRLITIPPYKMSRAADPNTQRILIEDIEFDIEQIILIE